MTVKIENLEKQLDEKKKRKKMPQTERTTKDLKRLKIAGTNPQDHRKSSAVFGLNNQKNTFASKSNKEN